MIRNAASKIGKDQNEGTLATVQHTVTNRTQHPTCWRGRVRVAPQRLLTLFFDFAFEKSLHGVFRGHVQRKLSFTVHRSHASAVLDQVPLEYKKGYKTHKHS